MLWGMPKVSSIAGGENISKCKKTKNKHFKLNNTEFPWPVPPRFASRLRPKTPDQFRGTTGHGK